MLHDEHRKFQGNRRGMKEKHIPGSELAYWIAAVLHDEREKVGISESEIATALRVNPRTIARLERGNTMAADIDGRVAAYAWLLGIDDSRDLWTKAISRWRKEGSPPRFQPIEGPAAAFAEAIRVVALRRRRDDDGRSEKRRASR